ncbi:hypothetical protein [Streptomyces sp. NPDC050504]|uniref:hypothetical protein n=1 Tax=Streptomyces sp. NPDC050504 TaxID=3365618 RepID=UPI0037A7D533
MTVVCLALAGCSSVTQDELDYQTDYSQHEPLRVVGYPSHNTLRVVQQVVWRLADGDVGGLADLAVEDGSPRKTARNWVDAFGEGAKGEVTADFYDEGSVRQVAVLYFKKTGQMKDIQVRIGADNNTWGVTMAEPDQAVAKARPTWAPAEPGATGSRTVRPRP